MSAFAVIFERTNTSTDPDVFNRVMERLSHRGPDGNDALITGKIAMGHWHFWTTPEEVEEHQPLEVNGLPFKIVLDGRIDNREELFTKLDISPAEGKYLSDAALILHAYARWGEHCFEHFIGEYALVIFDQQRNEVFCARDSLGERTLFYTLNDTCLVIASEPWSVAGVGNSNPELNEIAIAYHFALRASEDGQTWFKNIYELLPAHVMRVNASSEYRWRYWQPDPSIIRNRVRKSDQEYAEEFRSKLEESVRCRMRSSTPVGVLMSGGLDSPSVACLAAHMIAPQRLTTISYVFDELKECDEREYIETVKEKWNINSIQIHCDDIWPLKEWHNWKRNPNQPEGNLYRLLKERAYKRAHDEGLRVLMTGNNGDVLYSTGADWLADFIFHGRFSDAIREFLFEIRDKGLRKSLATGYLWRTARRLLDAVPGGRYIHRRQTAPEWITPFSANHLSKAKPRFDPVFARYAHLLGLWAAQDVPRETFSANRHQVEMRAPYRDRRLVEFVLALPAYQLYSKGQYKHILRTAMQGMLPELIRTRRKRTSLTPLFFRGVEREKSVFSDCFQNPNANWRKYIREDWLAQKRTSSASYMDMDGTESVIRWLCISYEAWYTLFTSTN